MKIVLALLPTTVTKPRDLVFSFEEEAMRVANDLLQPDGKGGYLNPYSINEPTFTIQEADPASYGNVPNTQPDGRKFLLLNFVKNMDVDIALVDPTQTPGRTLNQPIPFSINAGQALDELVNNPALKWKFGTEGSGKELSGTLEKLT